MTITQIYAVIALLVAFNVPQTTVNNVQTILTATLPSSLVNPNASFMEVAAGTAVATTTQATVKITSYVNRAPNQTYAPIK